MNSRPLLCALVGFLLSLQPVFAIGTADPLAPNSDPFYQQLRGVGLASGSVSVSNFEIKKDAATFHLTSGTLCFLAPVDGKVTGAVFTGEGTFSIEPPLASEKSSLELLSGGNPFLERFDRLVLRFTDSSYDELKTAGHPGSAPCDPQPLRDSQNAMRHNQELKYNLEARILRDILSSQPGGLFVAFIHGYRNTKELFILDPQGAPDLVVSVYPEEVEFLTYDENRLGVWAAFHRREEYGSGRSLGAEDNNSIHIEHQQLETTIEKSGEIHGKAVTTFVARVNGIRVVPFDLFASLRVQNVTGEDGAPLSFIQEGKNDDADFSVILPAPLSAGQRYTLTTNYGGKGAIQSEGNGNYDPIARSNWYPNIVSGSMGEFTSYDMTFRVPKGMSLAATGTLLSNSNKGDENITVWKSEVPQTVAGFSLGRFKIEEAKLGPPPFLVEALANETPPDSVKALLNQVNGILPGSSDAMGSQSQYMVALGSMNTTPMLKKALAEASLSVQLYSNYFGPLPFKRLSVTQQTSCDYGQSWPMLVWLPMCYLYDSSVREQLGIQWHDYGYWRIVAPHEVAHQWWGNYVGFNSYRDQWMSEGFADMSASLFIQLVEKDPRKFLDFWNDERTMLLERNAQGYRAIEAGPITLGYRLNNEKLGFDITRRLIYPKGAYVLHMLRMMMWNPKGGDQQFKAMMHDFVQTYGGRDATTEDFKAIVEKYMTPEMKQFGNGNMDWFFNEYVYGTQLPTYKVDYCNFDKAPNGDVVMSLKLTQSGVSNQFRMLVPLYLEWASGRVVLLGRAQMIGDTFLETKVPLHLKEAPKTLVINYEDDVLADK